jgi:hypothetical protein
VSTQIAVAEDYAGREVPELLDRIRSELDDRIAVLRPVVDEAARLQRARDALDRAGSRNPAPARSRAAAPARARPRTRPSGRRRTARAAPGQTQLRVIEQLRGGPGSTSTTVALALGISANAAAATISRLVKQGRVQRLPTGGYAAAEGPAGGSSAPAAPRHASN